MGELLSLRQSRPELSLRRFARYAGVPYWKLRDFEKSGAARNGRKQEREVLREQVKQVALLHPTYGYRFLYQELRAQGERVGLHRVRELLGELELNPPQPRKARKPSPEVVAAPDWPAGRRVQIDATRLSLADGVCWVYHVLDVQSRVVLASKAVRGLSMQLAKAVLDEGVAVLRSLGIYSSVLVQSDTRVAGHFGGSDFTGEVFQNACLRYGSWVRCKVSQRGGMGVLERLNRTYKYAFAFRHDWKSLTEVQAALPDFHRWYNRERRHSALSYGTPWATLIGAANPRIAA
jgi:transposase InsO family protein